MINNNININNLNDNMWMGKVSSCTRRASTSQGSRGEDLQTPGPEEKSLSPSLQRDPAIPHSAQPVC